MKTIDDFDLSTRQGRYNARKNGFDVPIYKPHGLKPKKDFWSLIDVRSENECWNWLGKLNPWGYGRIRMEPLAVVRVVVARVV